MLNADKEYSAVNCKDRQHVSEWQLKLGMHVPSFRPSLTRRTYNTKTSTSLRPPFTSQQLYTCHHRHRFSISNSSPERHTLPRHPRLTFNTTTATMSTPTKSNEAKSSEISFTARDFELLAKALKCNNNVVQVDYAKFAELAGFKNANSAKASWYALSPLMLSPHRENFQKVLNGPWKLLPLAFVLRRHQRLVR